jgi:putative protease
VSGRRSPALKQQKRKFIWARAASNPNIKVGEFNIETGSLKAGDTILITGRRHGAVKEQLHSLTVNGEAATVANRGDKLTLPVAATVLPTDKLYKIVEEVHA